ncbi:O-linked N-acetylglucosamine transferase family protein [Paraburkholderia adhaesiva]|uniref:O-linked N-acetylglucosamine transferase family protein n=1 Tax=Paraburkholderia adhaesiva TaxID=2883244 RepID=UPI001F281C4E|nr:tetratricopeptide repeat protein [Paraburkholderia adhaesiva]
MTTVGHSLAESTALAQQFQATIEMLIAREEFDQAEALSRQMTQLLPDAGYGWKALAFLRLRDGDLIGAYEPMRRSMALLPADTDLHPHWAAVCAAHEQATQPAPLAGTNHAAALPTRAQGEAAIALFDTGRFEEADSAARSLIEQFPAHPLGWKIRALTLYRLGQHQAYEPYLRRAHELIPEDPDVLQLYAALLEVKGNHEEAESICRKLLEVAPGHAEGTRLLGVVLMTTGRMGEAEPLLHQATKLAPESALAWNSLGSFYQRLGRVDAAAEQFLRALDHEPGGAGTWSNLLFCLTHGEGIDPDALFAAHCGFGEQFEAPFKPHWPRHANSREPERALRVGFVSADLRRHAVTNFLEPVLPYLARDPGLRLYAYSNTVGRDEVTERLRSYFAEWRDVSDKDDAAFVQLVEADGIDILIDLSGHTGYNRLPALARKPAPVQASWIGYPGTTGLTAIDYFLADRFWTPIAQFEALFTEKIVCLPAVAPFRPEQEAPPLNTLPALRNGYVTFGSFNRINKLQRDVVTLWAHLLRAVPTARLKIAAMPVDGNLETQLAAWFMEEGITRERLDFQPRVSVAEFLQLHHEVDIALDTLPFGGLTTALQSLWMGVPTLTLPGRTVPGRSGATVMGHAGLEQFVATSAQDFVLRGAALAADLPALAELRAGMRERCTASPMFQPEALARGVIRALRTMWRHWCEGQMPRSFEVPGESPLELPAGATAAKTGEPPMDRAIGNTHDHSRGIRTKNFIHQIYYSPETRAALDPGFIPLDNTGQRPDWYEYWPIRRFLRENALDPNARYGFFSPKFQEKTQLTSAQVAEFLSSTPDDVDIVTFSPNFWQAAFFKNVFEQAESWHKGIRPALTGTISLLMPGTNAEDFLNNLVMSSAQTVYCNYFVAKPRFWQRWLALCELIFNAAEVENNTELGRQLNTPVSYRPEMPARIFVIERIVSLILSVEQTAWKVRNFDSTKLPGHTITGAHFGKFLELDALKMAAIKTGIRRHHDKYLELRDDLIKCELARAADGGKQKVS